PLGVLSANPALKVDTNGSGGLLVTITAPQPASAGAAPTSIARYSFSAGVEAFDFTDITTVYDPLAAATLLRIQYSLPTPIDLLGHSQPPPGTPTVTGSLAPGSPTSPADVATPVLWGFMPLDDGWAQLPFLNATEQLIVDALP